MQYESDGMEKWNGGRWGKRNNHEIQETMTFPTFA
jgi:hypothetical protein